MLAWFKSLFGKSAEKKKRRQSRAYQKRVRQYERQLQKKHLGEHKGLYHQGYLMPGVAGGGGA